MIAHLDIKEKPNWDWFILLVAKTGMRFSEALAITPADFDFARQTLSVSKTWDYKGTGGFLPTKNKSSVRKIQIDWQIVVKFSELIKNLPEDKPIFVGKEKIYNSTVNDVLARHCGIVVFYIFSFPTKIGLSSGRFLINSENFTTICQSICIFLTDDLFLVGKKPPVPL